jgi:hypothetical protein
MKMQEVLFAASRIAHDIEMIARIGDDRVVEDASLFVREHGQNAVLFRQRRDIGHHKLLEKHGAIGTVQSTSPSKHPRSASDGLIETDRLRNTERQKEKKKINRSCSICDTSNRDACTRV